LIWVHVVLPLPSSRDQGSGNTSNASKPPHPGFTKSENSNSAPVGSPEYKLTTEKIRAIKLLLSFVYAVVHHLRNEPGIDYEDYDGVLPLDLKRRERGFSRRESTHLSRYATYAAIDRDHLSAHKDVSFHKGKSSADHDDIEPSQNTPLLGDDHTTVQFRVHETVDASSPLPLIIAHELTRVIFKFKRRGYIDTLGPAGFNAMNTAIAVMTDELTALERIATTPIPASYGIHLKQCVSLYLFTLPFTLIHDMHWRMVPLVTVVAFTLMGIEGIADRLEMPFRKGSADLPLDRYCIALRSELEYMIDRLQQGPDEDHDLFED